MVESQTAGCDHLENDGDLLARPDFTRIAVRVEKLCCRLPPRGVADKLMVGDMGRVEFDQHLVGVNRAVGNRRGAVSGRRRLLFTAIAARVTGMAPSDAIPGRMLPTLGLDLPA